MKANLFLFILLTLFISCSQKSEEQASSLMPYLSSLEELETDIHTIGDSEVLHSPHRMGVLSDGKIFINNAQVWDIHLIDLENKFLSTTGRVGRGPGEFVGINKITVSQDTIYVLDKFLKKIELFTIADNQLVHTNTIIHPSYGSTYIQDIFRYDGSYYGVFQLSSMEGVTKVNGGETSNPYQLYELNDDLELDKMIIEFGGADLIPSTFVEGFLEERLFGERSIWHYSEGKFYYSSNMSFSLEEIDLKNGESNSYDYSEIPKREKKQEEQNYILSTYNMLFQRNEIAKDSLENQKYLPSYISFKVSDNHAYYEVWSFYETKESKILRINLSTGEKQVIETFPLYSMKAVENDHIYGFDQTEEETRIKALEIF